MCYVFDYIKVNCEEWLVKPPANLQNHTAISAIQKTMTSKSLNY